LIQLRCLRFTRKGKIIELTGQEQVILHSNIKSLQSIGLLQMPPILEAVLACQAVADLLSKLRPD